MKTLIGITLFLAACTSQYSFNPQQQGYQPFVPEVKNNMTCLEYCEMTGDCDAWKYRRAKSHGYGCRLFFPKKREGRGR